MGAFKRSLFGYSRRQVDQAVAVCAEEKAQKDRELLLLSEMLVAREREVDTLRIQLADAHARHDRSLRSLEILAGHLDELQAQARGQATRIRMKALNDAALVTQRASQALEAVRKLEDAHGLNGRANGAAPVAAENGAAANGAGAAAAATAERGVSGSEAPGAVDAAWTADGSAPDTGRPADTGIGFYQGEVEVEIGPVGDFSQLLGFESAAGTIEGASEVSVRRFSSGRATLGMHLDEPIELLRELEERAPFEFKVRYTGGRKLVLDIDENSAE